MIDYNAFHNYLAELIGLYQRTRSTKGMSRLAQKWHCTALTRDQFYQMKLDRLQPQQLTVEFSRVVRDTIGRSDAKAILRESIGALNEGILAGSRISQGSDRTVQITITQPTSQPTAATQPVKPAAPAATQQPALPLYKPGWIVYRRGGIMHLVSRLLDGDRFTWNYTLTHGDDGQEYIIEENETSSSWMGNQELRRAKGPETARFVGALERDGYTWRIDNPNGLFFVTGRKADRERKSINVFASDLPDGYTALHPLPQTAPSDYRYAMETALPIDNAADYMTQRTTVYPALTNALLRQLLTVGLRGEGIATYMEYSLPTLCSSKTITEHTIGFVRTTAGRCFWLAKDRDVLRLLAWVTYIV